MNEKVDKVRAQELRQLKAEGYEPILKHSRWCLLKRPENRPRKQTLKIWELLKYNLRTMRTYLMMEDFQQFWGYSETQMGRQVPRCVVHSRDAQQVRADKRGGRYIALSPNVVAELALSER